MRKQTQLRLEINVLAVILLAVGLCASVVIYITAGDQSNNVVGYEQGDGTVYQVRPGDSRSYQHGLELYGGRANVLADDLRRWFSGLWHGTSLAFTTGFITVFISLVIFLAGNFLRSPR